MSKMTRKNKLLLLTFLGTSFLQMPFVALNPVIDYMQKNVFPDRSLAEVQTAVSLLNLFVTVFALLAALIIAKRILSKKAVVVTGLFVFAATGIAVIFLHTHYWNLWLLSVLIGAGSGLFISPMTSVLFDNFGEREMRLASGLQASTVNVGGIVFGLLGGAIATVIWYGGYLLELIGLSIAILALLTIPANKASKTAAKDRTTVKKSKIPLDIYYYSAITFVFFMLYIYGGITISTHLANANYTSPAIAGMASAVQMVGGVVAGLLFSKLSSKFGESILPIAFAVLFIGYTILNLGQAYLVFDLLGIFIAGMSLSMLFPYCIFSTSRRVDETNSATATSLVQAMAPGIGGFLSPIILTNVTTLIYPENIQTPLRYQFVGFIALVFGVLFLIGNRIRMKRQAPSGGNLQ